MSVPPREFSYIAAVLQSRRPLKEHLDKRAQCTTARLCTLDLTITYSLSYLPHIFAEQTIHISS